MHKFAKNTKSRPQLPSPRDCPEWFTRMPLARWGWRELNLYGWPLLAATLAIAFLGWPLGLLALIPGCLLFLLLYFFRDPRREIPGDPSAIVSPADGTVVDVTAIEHYEFFGGPAIRVGIFLSIFNVHINRAPLAGRVVDMRYEPGQFLNAMRPESAELNEFMWIGFELLEPPRHRFAVRQISGMLARRIVCPLEPGQTLARGEKFGMIKLGSRTELILPANPVEIRVRPGDKVHAGSDLVAVWK
ncbi:MAG TPA: phosphatidylserine decarboxylase [Lacipirellulaceae bacterium]|jgi:phosphatidylserine decarboxylase|nr:phosphatidylserine decarboxylase [Lacipirellulaceae bacterium]